MRQSLAVLALASSLANAASPAVHDVTFPTGDGDVVVHFPEKPGELDSGPLKTTGNEHCSSTGFAVRKPAFSFTSGVVDCAGGLSSRVTAQMFEGVFQSINAYHKDHPLGLADLSDVTVGGWKGRELIDERGDTTFHFRFFVTSHAFVSMVARWHPKDPVGAAARIQFITPLIRSNAPAALKTTAPPPVEFFYADIREILALEHRMMTREKQCAEMFVDRCKLPPELTNAAIERGFHLLGVLTHAGFERLPPVPKPETMTQVLNELPGLKSQINVKLLDAEKTLIAKIAAVMMECPGEKAAVILDRLPIMEQVNFMRFWEQSLDVYKRTQVTVMRQMDDYQKQIKAGWSAERCAATYDVAIGMSDVLLRKTKPFASRKWDEIPRTERFERATGFAWELAYSLEYEMDPTIEKRLD